MTFQIFKHLADTHAAPGAGCARPLRGTPPRCRRRHHSIPADRRRPLLVSSLPTQGEKREILKYSTEPSGRGRSMVVFAAYFGLIPPPLFGLTTKNTALCLLRTASAPTVLAGSPSRAPAVSPAPTPRVVLCGKGSGHEAESWKESTQAPATTESRGQPRHHQQRQGPQEQGEDKQ